MLSTILFGVAVATAVFVAICVIGHGIWFYQYKKYVKTPGISYAQFVQYRSKYPKMPASVAVTLMRMQYDISNFPTTILGSTLAEMNKQKAQQQEA